MTALLLYLCLITFLFMGCGSSQLVTKSKIPGDIDLGASKSDVAASLDLCEPVPDTLRTPGTLGRLMGAWTICFCLEEKVEWTSFETDYRYADSLEHLLVAEYGESRSHRPAGYILSAYRRWEMPTYFVWFNGGSNAQFPAEYFKNTCTLPLIGN